MEKKKVVLLYNSKEKTLKLSRAPNDIEIIIANYTKSEWGKHSRLNIMKNCICNLANLISRREYVLRKRY
ncbi:hypothetical protein CMI47_01950 [Candidatus Pacearchaeota archaeon]|jgi:hypothetical protein|nr:hypothetical protein [Candidatus Pacearchaeota archaeon]|tara:strand:+ start:4395 stop:4604 length:210 start_codon:yes stop_codon:yes gene_type:complete